MRNYVLIMGITLLLAACNNQNEGHAPSEESSKDTHDSQHFSTEEVKSDNHQFTMIKPDENAITGIRNYRENPSLTGENGKGIIGIMIPAKDLYLLLGLDPNKLDTNKFIYLMPAKDQNPNAIKQEPLEYFAIKLAGGITQKVDNQLSYKVDATTIYNLYKPCPENCPTVDWGSKYSSSGQPDSKDHPKDK